MHSFGPTYPNRRSEPLFEMPTRVIRAASSGRQVRSDKLIDTKIPVTEGEMKQIRWLGLQRSLSATKFATTCVREQIALISSITRPERVQTFGFVHVKLSQQEHALLGQLAIDAHLTTRQAARRCLELSLWEGR